MIIEVGKIYRRYDGVFRLVQSIERTIDGVVVKGKLFDPSCDPPKPYGPSPTGDFFSPLNEFAKNTTAEIQFYDELTSNALSFFGLSPDVLKWFPPTGNTTQEAKQ